MVERNDPARAGVRAGRVVGLLTAALAVATLASVRGSYYASVTQLLDLAGLDSGLPVGTLFWGNVALAAVARYSVAYVVGSLVGVVYDWLDRPSVAVLTALVAVVGVVDGVLGGLHARSVAVGSAYLVAWLCYVPAFVRFYDPDAGDDRSGARRLGER